VLCRDIPVIRSETVAVYPLYRLIFFSVRHATGHVTKLGQLVDRTVLE
jgi:hypothetical protein